MVRKTAYDISEMAIVTYLQAKSHGKPLVLMPCVMLGRFQHGTLLYNSARGKLSLCRSARPPRRRALLHPDHRHLAARAPAERLRRRHLSRELGQFRGRPCAEYRDPPFVERAGDDKNLLKMVQDGELDAGIFGAELPSRPAAQERDRRIPTRRPSAGRPSTAWCRSITWWCVTEKPVAASKPELVREVYRMLKQSKQAAGLPKPGSHRLPSVRGRGLPAGARDDHQLCGSAEADPAAVRGRRAVRRHHPGARLIRSPAMRIRGRPVTVTQASKW